MSRYRNQVRLPASIASMTPAPEQGSAIKFAPASVPMKPIEATVAAAVGGRPGPVAAAVGCAVRQVREALGAAIAGRAPALNEDLVVTPNDFITKWRDLRAEGALGLAGALHRPVPSAGRTDAGRRRPDG